MPVRSASGSALRRAGLDDLPADEVWLRLQGPEHRLQHMPQAADLIDEVEYDRDAVVVDPEIGLQIPDQLGPGHIDRDVVPDALPERRSLDLVHDRILTGRRFRVLNILDDVTRACIRAVVDTSLSGRRGVRALTDLIAERGRPKMIVSDNGTALTSKAGLA